MEVGFHPLPGSHAICEAIHPVFTSRLHVMVTRSSAFQRFRLASGLHLPNGSRLTPVKVSGSDLASQLRQPDRTASRLGKASSSLLIWMIADTFRQPQPTYVDSAQSTCNVNGDDMSCEDADDRAGFALHRLAAPCPRLPSCCPRPPIVWFRCGSGGGVWIPCRFCRRIRRRCRGRA